MSQQQTAEKATVKTFSSFAEFAANFPQVAAANASDIEIVPPVAAGASLKSLAERATARQEARETAQQSVDGPSVGRKAPRA